MNNVRLLFTLTILTYCTGFVTGSYAMEAEAGRGFDPEVGMLDVSLQDQDSSGLLMEDEECKEEAQQGFYSEDDFLRSLPELLLRAVIDGDEDMACELIEQGAQVDYQDENGLTSLIVAAEEGNLFLVQLLLTAVEELRLVGSTIKDDVSWIDLQERKGYTALMRAAENNNIEVLRMLLDAGARMDMRDSTRGMTAFLLGAFHGHSAVVEILLRCNPEHIVSCDKDGDTALMIATFNDHANMVDTLIEHGAQRVINAQNQQGATILMAAVWNNSFVLARVLVRAGAWMGILKQDHKGETALSYAKARNPLSELSKLLRVQTQIAKKVDPNLSNLYTERDEVPVMSA